jgi:hypothetical protein
MRIMKMALTALFAVLAFSAMAASSASAFHPLFLNLNGSSWLLFTGTSSGLPTLLGLNVSTLGTITCEKALSHGYTLNKSTLADLVTVLFEGNCIQQISGNVGTCGEITTKLLSGELGLLLVGTSKLVGLLLIPESGSEFVEVKCTNGNTKVEGAIVGEFPEINGQTRENQYNKNLTSYELVFESVNKASENQKYTEIDLLNVKMTKAELKVEGFFGGKASQETTSTLKAEGEISTK